MLEVEDLHAFYGSSHVVQGISFAVDEGEAVALVGRNGVGKTSTLKSLMGLETRTRGMVRFLGASLMGMASHIRASKGLGFMIATALLHLTGIGAGFLIGKAGKHYGSVVVRSAGGLATVAGVALLVAILA